MPDPAPETDRELLDRLLPVWVFHDRADGFARVVTPYMNGDWCVDRATAVNNAATALRAILARDRDTRGEAAPPPLRRVPVQIAAYDYGTVVLASDGTIWEFDSRNKGCIQLASLPQPGEDGGA